MRNTDKVSTAVSSEDQDDEHAIPAEIEDLCILLFNLWCERRSVIPLAYLMHSWPAPTLTSHFVRRLSETLGDLVTFHHDTLAIDERKLIFELLKVAFNKRQDLVRRADRGRDAVFLGSTGMPSPFSRDGRRERR